jgi:hypothetical protein
LTEIQHTIGNSLTGVSMQFPAASVLKQFMIPEKFVKKDGSRNPERLFAS